MASQPRIKMERIVDAAGVIDPVFLNSPQFNCEPLSEALGAQLTLKIESMNPIRCFKGRGADFLVAEAERAGDEREMICASAGNFGQAMAYSARRRGRSVAVYAAENASPLKIERMRALGADVRLFGADFDTAKSEARKVAAETGARMVEDGLDVETAEGAGTIGLELTEDGAPLDAVIVPLGNGALINGIATAVKANSPSTQVIAVQSDGAPAMIESWRTETVVETETVDTIADGIAVRVPVPEALDRYARDRRRRPVGAGRGHHCRHAPVARGGRPGDRTIRCDRHCGDRREPRSLRRPTRRDHHLREQRDTWTDAGVADRLEPGTILL